MKKIIVVGCPGSGKSTFSKALHEITKIPLFHLDMLYWKPDRTIVDVPIFYEKQLNIIKKDLWIIDGNYGSTMELRFQACDTVIFLDYSLEVCLKGIEERRGKPRTDMPWKEKDGEEDVEFLEFVKNYNCKNRPQVIELINKYSDKNIYIFKNRTQADEFLSEKKIGYNIIC